MNTAFYQNNRAALAKMPGEDRFLLVMSTGYPICRSADEDYDFQPNTNALYFLGIRQPMVHYAMVKSPEKTEEFLFIDEYSEFYELWIGHRLTKAEAGAICGIPEDHILYTAEFDAFFTAKAEECGTVYLDLEKRDQFGYQTFGLYLADKLGREAKDFYPFACRLRMAKQDCEVDCIRRAIEVTKHGIESLMTHAKAGEYEYQLEAWFDHVIKENGNRKLSFKTIAASGINATTIHYSHNNSVIGDGDLLLFDLGCRDEEYCADVTRTFPVNGKFNDLQKTIYSIVLHTNKTIANEAKAGMTTRDLQKRCIELLTEGCMNAGLIKEPEEIKKYYVHGVSHHIGLDCHDASIPGEPLPVGAIISDEPGLYFPEYKIGVRIEDDLLITETGAVNLTADIIKEIDEIESYMAR